MQDPKELRERGARREPTMSDQDGSAAVVPLAYPAGQEASRTARANARSSGGEHPEAQHPDVQDAGGGQGNSRSAKAPAGSEAKEKPVVSALGKPWVGISTALFLIAAITAIIIVLS